MVLIRFNSLQFDYYLMHDSIGIDFFSLDFWCRVSFRKRSQILFAFPSWVILFNSSMFVSCLQEDDNCYSDAARIHLCPLNIRGMTWHDNMTIILRTDIQHTTKTILQVCSVKCDVCSIQYGVWCMAFVHYSDVQLYLDLWQLTYLFMLLFFSFFPDTCTQLIFILKDGIQG